MEHDYRDIGVRVAPGAATELPSRRPGQHDVAESDSFEKDFELFVELVQRRL